MARHRVTPLFPIAVSVMRLAESIGVHRKHIDRAVADGELRVYQRGQSRRILVEDAVHWIKTTWKIKGGRHVAPGINIQHGRNTP
jgi:excisionase family DNA binding protein